MPDHRRVSGREPGGKPLASVKKVAVVVTVDGGLDDREVERRFGAMAPRRPVASFIAPLALRRICP